MFLKLLLHAGKIFITRRIITRDVENDPRIYQQTSFSIPAKISLRSTKNDRTNERNYPDSHSSYSNRFLYRFFRFEAGSRGTSFSCRSRFPIRTEWIGRAENKRLPWSSCLWWSCRLSRDSKEETRKRGRRDSPIGREQKEKPAEGKVEKEMGREEKKERNLSAGILGRGDSKSRERER